MVDVRQMAVEDSAAEGEDDSTPSLRREEAPENTTEPGKESEVRMKRNIALGIITAVALVAATVFVTLQVSGDSSPARAERGDSSPPAVVSPTEAPSVNPDAEETEENPDGTEPTGRGFNPYPFYSQSCSPNETCSWDVGTMGSLTYNGSPATQVGIVKGVSVEWDGKVADAGPSGRCSLVVLTPNSWFENLTTSDVNVTVYNVYTGDNDVVGWMKTLAVQAAQEQTADHGCPQKSYPDDFDVWGSKIPSPPCGVEGFDNCGDQTSSGSDQANASSCETLDCGNRKATADFGGELSFKEGDAVAGFEIVLSNGARYSDCFFEAAPSAGRVVDGVVHPWADEVSNLGSCS